MKMSASVADQLCYCTVRIICQNKQGETRTGTGFLFRFEDHNSKHIPLVLTNKHVVSGMTDAVFVMTRSDSNGNPIYSDYSSITITDLGSMILNHPESEVDLCAIPFAPILLSARSKGINLYYSIFTTDLIPSQAQLDQLQAIEEIIMIGYPNGLWDDINNMPIFRRGITATHPRFDYRGKKEFMIDAACFPGSSGSPVLIYNAFGYTTSDGLIHINKSRLYLMGLLFAGPQHTVKGDIQIVNIPTAQVPVSISSIPNNLGIVIKAERILELRPLIPTE